MDRAGPAGLAIEAAGPGASTLAAADGAQNDGLSGTRTAAVAWRRGVEPCPGSLCGLTATAMSSIALKPKRRGRPSTGGRHPITATRMPAQVTAALDAAAAADERKISRSELIRQIVTEWLKGKGYLG